MVSFYAPATSSPCLSCYGLAARRERSGDFCRALLEAAERGGSTRDRRKNAPVGALELPQVSPMCLVVLLSQYMKGKEWVLIQNGIEIREMIMSDWPL